MTKQTAARRRNGHPKPTARFSLGQVFFTPGALEALEPFPHLTSILLKRHVTGDWSEMDAHDQEQNRQAIQHGRRVFSSYRLPDKTKIWLITEADRSVTTFLLPSEY